MFLSAQEADHIPGESTTTKSRSVLNLALGLLLLVNVVLDQITKVIAEKNLMVWSHPTDLRSYQGMRHPLGTWGSLQEQGAFYVDFAFTYVRNQGAAWGFLSDMPDQIRIPFFYMVSFVAIGMILNYLRTTPPEQRFAKFALSLILSGAAGNLLDRIRLGYVIDFLDVRWSLPLGHLHWAYDFPKFNWADSCITVGVTCLIIHMMFFEERS